METVYTKSDGLSQNEQKLIAWFRTTDNEGRNDILVWARLQARDHPEPPPRACLRLVKGGES